MSNWETRRLVDLTTKIGSGATPRGGKGVYQDVGTSFIRSQNVYDLRFDDGGLAHISDQAADALKGVTVNSEDVLVNITGESVTRTCLVADEVLPARVSQHVAIVRANPQSLDPRYLLYSLISPRTKATLNTLSQAGATRRALTKGHLEALEIQVPPLEEQERIAGVLGAFDDLIETNRRLAFDLEALAKGVSSRPRGRVPLAQIADVPRLVQRRPEGLVDHYSIPAYDSGYLASRESSEAILSGKQVLDRDSVLISRLNPTTERTWMAYPDAHVRSVCSPEFAVVRGSEEVPAEVLWAFTSSREFWDQMRGSVGGTTNSRQRVDKATIPTFEVPDPSELSAQESVAIKTCVRAAVELRREAAELSSQRDELLALLMSARVRVRDVEAAVS